MAQATASEMSNQELQDMIQAVVGKVPDLQLTRENTALLIIDIYYGDAHPDYGLGARPKKLGIDNFLDYYWSRMGELVVPNIQRVLDAARRAGIEVIHVRGAFDTQDGRERSLRDKAIHLRQPKGTKNSEFLPEVSPQGDELVVSKLTSSVFTSTNIDRMLHNIGIQNLIVVGVVTNGCVESATRSAVDHDYGTIVVEDATAAFAPQYHDQAILTMGSLQYASIKSTAEVVKLLEAL